VFPFGHPGVIQGRQQTAVAGEFSESEECSQSVLEECVSESVGQ
jgi:hypothetical protein